MGKGMPVHLEKGPTLALFEAHLNRSNLPPTRKRRRLLDELRRPSEPDSDEPYPWLASGFVSLLSKTDVGVMANGNAVTGAAVQEDLETNWFGHIAPAVAGGGPAPLVPLPGSIGYWIAYSGDVAEIVRKAVCWAVELSLGLPPNGTANGRLLPRRIELFWTCPSPWFESWVVVRPGTISVVFMTPSHQGSNVSETPIAHSPTTRPAGSTHPVPSTEPDYEVLGKYTAAVRVAPQRRAFATWVVSHEQHQLNGDLDVAAYSSVLADLAEWDIPRLGVFQGSGPIEVVSPSFPAGGVTYNGKV